MINPYNNLYIYYLDGIPNIDTEVQDNGAFLGIWEDEAVSFLFFSCFCDDIVKEILKKNKGIILVEKYEEEAFPISDPDPVHAVLFYIEQNGLERANLGKTLGSRSRASEFLNRKSDLSITQIRKLHKEWHIPANILIQPVAM